ncbi:hypothetical protein L484_004494 [Morus notabilis]|uniref:Uncharacterized protein n=2 Tax=Morus notabilis TaxID=981085 RepID=W9QL47_9ROSA|nr:hypothetical protein L484_004494 [Morus notabilis]
MGKSAAKATSSPEENCSDTDDSSVFLSGRGSPENGDSESSPSPETPSILVWKDGLFPWKKRRLGDWRRRVKPGGQLTNSTSGVNNGIDIFEPDFPVGPFQKAESNEFSSELGYDCQDYWDVKELVSKDGQSKLKANFLFAPFDQLSKRASGATACTAISVVNAHWLHNNRDQIPTGSEFGSLIVQGSFEWRGLCEQEAYRSLFPDKHFDLETVLRADIRPLAVQPEKSLIGFFSPDKFETLKGTMSFDQIWDVMSVDTNTAGFEPKIYIVSWNDHFFVLKMEEDAYYIIDSLGLRLYAGCDRAYILKFDNSSVVYGKDEEVEGSDELAKPIFHGKECCREFIKRFLAAQTVQELEEGDKRGMVSALTLYQRLQIEFHYTSRTLHQSPSSSADSSTLSLCSSEDSSEYETS